MKVCSICELGAGEIRVEELCFTHSNTLASVVWPLLTNGFPDHLGFDNKIVDGRVVCMGKACHFCSHFITQN